MIPKLRFPNFSNPWKSTPLGQVADPNIRWSITGGPFGSNLKAEDYVDSGVRIIQLQNIGDGVFHDDYKIFTSEEKANSLLSCNIYPKEIIISKMGDPVARCCIIPSEDKRYLMASDGIRLVVNKEKFNTKYVHDFINSEYFRKIALETSTGSTRKRIGLDELKAIPILHPDLEEQEKIADVFIALDQKIELISKRLSLLDKFKKGVMNKIFTREIRFTDKNGGSYPEWELKPLTDIATIVGGGTPETGTNEYWGGPIQWFTPAEINTKYSTNSRRTITESGLRSSSAKLLPAGTILFSSRATIGEISIALNQCTTNQGFQSFIVNEQNNNEFIYYWINEYKDMFLKKAVGSTFLEISKSEMEKFTIERPHLEEQTKIANFLSAIDEKISNVQKQLLLTKQYKQGLLQQMFV